jgi:hypothetical protein
MKLSPTDEANAERIDQGWYETGANKRHHSTPLAWPGRGKTVDATAAQAQ